MTSFFVIFNKDNKVLDTVCSDSVERAIETSRNYYADDFGYVMLIGEPADTLYIGAKEE